MKYINIILRKVFFLSFLPLLGGIGAGFLSSCSDMLETESSLFDPSPSLNNKTDSVFFAYGIMQAMQQLADQYYFQNEMRGDLVKTTARATTHLKNLANYTADTENKYDSVYLYYKVINNCNYYLQNRDTTLRSGTKDITIDEYAAVAAFRAWAYLQLTKQYGAVPYITTPVLTVSDINAHTQSTSYEVILRSQAEILKQLASQYTNTPEYQDKVEIGHLNSSSSLEKSYKPSKCFLPVNVVLGDIYLELGDYRNAAIAYHDYLVSPQESHKAFDRKLSINFCNNNFLSDESWNKIFSANNDAQPNEEVISYIPMAVNYSMGQTTEVPAAFGYDYYSSTYTKYSQGKSIFKCPETNELQVVPSDSYMTMIRNNTYYFAIDNNIVSEVNSGDARGNMFLMGEGADSTNIYVQKPSTGFFYLYRNTTVFLRLAEALNRMGEPELAFAILKNGINETLNNCIKPNSGEDDNNGHKYIPESSYQLILSGELDFLTTPHYSSGETTTPIFTSDKICGVHKHGAGDITHSNSTYTYKNIVEERIEKIRQQFAPGKVGEPYSKEEYINAVEDLLCDEYALEFAFEGTRFGDLQRIARHKNENNPYEPGFFGYTWFAYKLKNNTGNKSFGENDWYLPFK